MTARLLAHRADPLWLAALIHRVSGLALAAFLPLHFLTLGLALEDEARLDSFLRWSDQPLVKFSEAVLVFLLAIHVLGGLRLLVVENLPWCGGQKWLAAGAAAAAVLVAFFFLVTIL
jgi:succinate dehydrogenase subunit D